MCERESEADIRTEQTPACKPALKYVCVTALSSRNKILILKKLLR